MLLKVQETLAYPAAAQDAELLEKLQAVLDNRKVGVALRVKVSQALSLTISNSSPALSGRAFRDPQPGKTRPASR